MEVVCSGSGRAYRWVGVPFWPTFTWRLECGHILKQLFFRILRRFVKLVRRRDEKPIVSIWSLGLFLGGSLAPFGAQKEVMLNPARVSQSGAFSRRKHPPEPEQNTSETWPLSGG